MGIRCRVDQIDVNTEVMLSEYLIFVILLKRCWLVLDIPICREWVIYELEVKGDVRKCVAVFDPTHQVRLAFTSSEPLVISFLWKCSINSWSHDKDLSSKIYWIALTRF